MSANQILFENVNAAGLWFPARKVAAIWARRLDRSETVPTPEGVQLAPAGSWLCRGAKGEVWPQAEEHLLAKYGPTEEADDDGWRKYKPRPEKSVVMAARIDHEFTVQSAAGVLVGKMGDYLIKHWDDRDNAIPRDVWVVDQHLFVLTYLPLDEADRPPQPGR